MNKKLIRGVFALLALVFVLPLMAHERHEDHSRLAVDRVEGDLSVMVLGSGGPVATPAGRASAGYLVFTDGKPRLLMDLGGGTYKTLAASGANIHDMEYILLSHLHEDHMGELSPMIKSIYFQNNRAGTTRSFPINVYGPKDNGVPFPGTSVEQYPSTTEYVHEHYDMPNGSDRYLRLFVKAISQGGSTFNVQAHDLNSAVAGAAEETLINTPDGLVVKAIAVDHGPCPAVAYRIEYKGHSVVYSGDTGSKGPNMVTISRGADMLIYDTSILPDEPTNPVFHTLHTEPARIGEVAVAAGVKSLVLSHITPVTDPRIDEVKSIIRANGFAGHLSVAHDLKVYNLGDED